MMWLWPLRFHDGMPRSMLCVAGSHTSHSQLMLSVGITRHALLLSPTIAPPIVFRMHAGQRAISGVFGTGVSMNMERGDVGLAPLGARQRSRSKQLSNEQ